MALAQEPISTFEGQAFPAVRQVSVFLDNRVGQLLNLTQVLDTQDVKIIGLSVVDAVDCAIVRLLFDDTDLALPALRAEGFPCSITEILVVRLPVGKRAMMTIWSVLLSAEVNVTYSYILLTADGPSLALAVDSIEIAIDTLLQHKFELLTESDLKL